MFRKLKEKSKDVDIESLNHILVVGKKLMNIGYFMAIMCLILLGTYLIKEWNILTPFDEWIKASYYYYDIKKSRKISDVQPRHFIIFIYTESRWVRCTIIQQNFQCL